MSEIALYQPDIPQNLGSILRLCACMEVACHIIEPCGFILDDARIKRVAMDYIDNVTIIRHLSWEKFTIYAKEQAKRIILLTTKTDNDYFNFAFQNNDILLLGRESSGVPQAVADYVDAKVKIMMSGKMRSFNIAMAGGIVLSEAIRQIRHVSL
jgi:tRNA (cytidine/uridine-2'-O-)-methyltransferase